MEREDEARPLFFGGLAAALIAALFGLFGPHDGSVWRMPQILRAHAEEALVGAGLPALDVRMDGQRAIVQGVVANQGAIDAARRAALTSSGAGGIWSGGVTTADVSDVRVGETASPFTWRVVKDDRRITFYGAAPSPDVRGALLSRARALLPNAEVIDQMAVFGGAPSSHWRDVALDAVTQVSTLSRGEARLNDGNLVVIGEGERAAVARLRAHYDQPLARPFRARADVNVRGEPLPIPELADLDLSNAAANVCETAFQRLMAHNVINFESGSAALDRSSLPLLDNLASVALRCDRFEIEVSGHTDNQGPRDLNLDLSRRRAEAVVSYLETLNVAPERLHAMGYGPDQPIQSNASPQGQAANRRIVFTVRG